VDGVRGWWKLHIEEVHKLCSSPDITRIVKCSRTKWMKRVVCMEEVRNAHRMLFGKPEGVDHSEDISSILEWILGK
jgi:hypothetical protein